MRVVEPGRQAVHEAVATLGYLTEAAEGWLFAALGECGYLSPKAVATAHRKDGEQISREEKIALGIRSNAFMSRRAAAELTEKGRSNPLEAHASTLLRAYFTALRYREIAQAARGGAISVMYNGIFKDECLACAQLDGTAVPIADASPDPPEGCQKATCPMGYLAQFEGGVWPSWWVLTPPPPAR